MVMFTSDNFNKYPEARTLLEAMIDEKLELPFFVQCDTQIAKQEDLVELLSRAGCFQMFVGVESFNRKILIAAHKTQNHPQLYGDIVRLCRRYGIGSHFSNIIGFPEDTEASIQEHLDTLIGLGPDVASFYILTPIPGTEQYDEFRANSQIYEKNLDRFDGTCPTWQHHNLTPERLMDLLFQCYNRFYSTSHIIRHGMRIWKTASRPARLVPLFYGTGADMFCRYAALRKMHPMSGGIGRVFRDRAEDYRSLRINRFGYDLVPLPSSLPLSPEDALLNSRAKVN
jgi:radical SAM superfamily enzyme YgiQ (UPF0313 family)